MGYLSKVFNDYYNSSNEKEQIKIKREFRERIWNSLPYIKMDRSFRYKVIEDIIEDKELIPVFHQYSNMGYKILKSRYNINELEKEDLVKARINSNYGKYFDKDIYLHKEYYRNLAHLKNIYFKYIYGDYDFKVENEMKLFYNKAEEYKKQSQDKKIDLEWDKYKGFINACFDRVFKNYRPMEEKIEKGEFTPNMILDWDEDNYVLCYINKSLNGEIKKLYDENMGTRYSKKKRLTCEVCGKEIITTNPKARNKYCKECAKQVIKESDKIRKRNNSTKQISK